MGEYPLSSFALTLTPESSNSDTRMISSTGKRIWYQPNSSIIFLEAGHLFAHRISQSVDVLSEAATQILSFSFVVFTFFPPPSAIICLATQSCHTEQKCGVKATECLSPILILSRTLKHSKGINRFGRREPASDFSSSHLLPPGHKCWWTRKVDAVK